MQKEILLTPGPTAIPQRIFDAMQCPTLHHRTEVFKKHVKKAQEGLTWLMECETTPIMLACSGSGALEAALLNTCSAGDKIIAINAGVFGERWVKMGKRFGLTVVEIKADPGESPSLSEVEAVCKANTDAKAFLVQSCETSTTVLHPFSAMAKICKNYLPDALFCVDAISALVTLPHSAKEIGIDILAGASQKALMLPPGLSFLGLSERAWKRVEKNGSRSYYFDLQTERDSQRQSTTAWTPAISLILGLNEAVNMIREEGLENVYKRHARHSKAARAGLRALGFQMLAEKFPSPGVSGAIPYAGIDADGLRSTLLSLSGVRIAGGQGSLKGKIIRIGHMGYTCDNDLIAAFAGLESALVKLGHVKEKGQALLAVTEELSRVE